MEEWSTLRRRQFVTGVAGLAAAGSLAGCSEESGGDESEPSTETADDTSSDDQSTDDSDANGSEGTADELDLREANVVGVSVAADGDSYSFDVTLHHDDDGEDGYANWWQVERLDGSQLGRRELLHAHSRQPFTRSETIQIPGDVRCVVVRGHDQTHGYGGQAMVVSLGSGETQPIEQGADRQPVGESDCP